MSEPSEPPFQLPRQGKEPYDNTKVLVYHLNRMENRIMASLEDVVADLRAAITNANVRFENVGKLEQALNEERAKYDALLASEDAEDVQQNQELADAKAATDNALAQAQGLTTTLTELTDQVNSLGNQAPAPAEADSSAGAVTDTPADAPADAAPAADVPADAPVEDTPTDTPAPAEAPVDTPDETADAPAADAPVADAPAADA